MLIQVKSLIQQTTIITMHSKVEFGVIIIYGTHEAIHTNLRG